MTEDIEFWKLAVVMKKSGLSKTEIYRRMEDGRFPKARNYGGEGARKFWVSTEVIAWQQSLLTAH